jgi:hypothetical protein
MSKSTVKGSVARYCDVEQCIVIDHILFHDILYGDKLFCCVVFKEYSHKILAEINMILKPGPSAAVPPQENNRAREEMRKTASHW